MGQFRRETLGLALTVMAWTACAGGAVNSAIVIKNLEKPGAFSVTNEGPDIDLERHVVVEKQEGGAWTNTDADVRLIASCEELETGTTRRLARGETLVVKGWDGWSCDGQCPRPCRANLYLGPGTFRFVVQASGGKQRWEGPAFQLGEDPRK